MDRCAACHGMLTFEHDHKPDQSGLDDGPPLPIWVSATSCPAPASATTMMARWRRVRSGGQLTVSGWRRSSNAASTAGITSGCSASPRRACW